MEISGKEIEDLDPAEFVELVNSLLYAEAHRLKIPPTQLKLNSYTTGREGGVDGRIEDTEKLGDSRWIPSGLSVWQFKSDRSGNNTLPGELKQEAAKPRVLDALKAGGRYIVAIARVCDDTMREEREKALHETVEAEGFDRNSVRLITADDLKGWAGEHFSLLLLPFFHRPFGPCMRMEKWELDSLHQIEYVVDDSRKQIIDSLREFVKRTDSPLHKHILGRRGVGKTRVVMEALRPIGIRDRVIYVPGPEDIPSDFWPYLREKTASTAILAVDECDDSEASKLKLQADACEGRVRLLTVGVGEPFLPRISPNYVFLERLDDESIRKLLATGFRALSQPQIEWIARLTGGYVRLTVACASAVAQNPSIDVVQLTRSPEIRHSLDVLLPGTSERRVMQSLALLTRVGFEGEVMEEAKTLAGFVDVSWSEFSDVTERMRHKGLVSRKGRYRYVTPDLLASWLAADIWNSRTDEVRALLNTLPTSGSRTAFYERLKDLGADEKTQTVIRSLLSEQNFPTIAELDCEQGSRIVFMLALANPPAALATLERLLNNVEPEKLRYLKKGRRNIVNALDYIKWFRGTFFGAARLLLLLAEAENEEWSNNATGTWTGLFLLHLGGTEVPAIDRFSILEDELGSNSPTRRMLVLKAIAEAMSLHEVRSSRVEKEGIRSVPPEWHPQKLGEIWEVYRKALQIIDRIMLDENKRISEEARKILIQSARAVVVVGLTDEVISRFEVFKPKNDGEQRELRDSIRIILQYERDRLQDSQIHRLTALEGRLAGATFHDLLRRWLGQWSMGDWDIQKREGGLPSQERAAELAKEALKYPEQLRSELDWLVSDEAANVGYFGKRLGELDGSRAWLSELETKTRGERARPILLATYLGGRNAVGDRESVRARLDHWVENDKQLARVVLLTTLNLQPQKENLDRLLKLVQKDWIQRKELIKLVWSGWAEKLPHNEMISFLAFLLDGDSPENTEAALNLLDRRLKSSTGEIVSLAPFAWQALARKSAVEGMMPRHYWGEVSKHYVQVDPVKLADTVLELYRTHDLLFVQDDEPLKALAKATQSKPKEVWGRVADTLLRKDRASYRLLLSLQCWYVEILDAAQLLTWAEQHKPEGPQILAALTAPSGIPMNELPRQLLVRYGADDVVRRQLYANFQTGSFTGSMTAYFRDKMETAQKWSEDSDQTVRNWAKRLAGDLMEQVSRFQIREEEEDLI